LHKLHTANIPFSFFSICTESLHVSVSGIYCTLALIYQLPVSDICYWK